MIANHRHARFVLALALLAGGLLAAVFGAGAGAEVAPTAAQAESASLSPRQETALDSPWRRTNRGWELMTDWPQPGDDPPIIMARPLLHPGLLAVFLLLVSLGALLAAEKDPIAASAARAGK